MSAITKPGIPKFIPSAARLSSHQDPLLSAPFSQKVWLYRDYFILSVQEKGDRLLFLISKSAVLHIIPFFFLPVSA
jgi:hypothetical protein